jgi:hypothetical protein
VLEGTVVEASGAPAAGCAVQVSQEGETLHEQSGGDGRFALIVVARKDLVVTADCGTRTSAPVSLRLEADHALTLRLAPRRGLNVTVLSEATGEPLAGARVSLLRGEASVTTTTSDPSGLATLESAAFVDRLRVTAKGHIPQELPPRGWGATDAVPLVVRLLPSAALTVAVMDERGTPVPGASVRLTPRLAIRGETFEAVTGAEGTAVWDALPRSTFEVEASHSELGLGRAPSVSWGGTRPERVRVTLGSGPAIAGRVLDVARKPVSEATVVFTRRMEFGTGPEFTVRADAYGRFRLAGVGEGTYFAYARHGTLASPPVHIRGGNEDVELTIQGSGRIEGRVVTRSGQTVPGAMVTVRGLDAAATPRNTRADERGVFQVDGLGEGRVEVSAARAEGGARVKKQAAAGERVAMELPDDGGLRGRVRTDDGRPISSLTVSIVAHGERVAEVQGGGEFRVPGVPPGTVVFEVRAPGYASPPLRSALVSEGRETDLGEFVLTRGRAVEGTVLNESGKTVAGATVHAGTRLIGNAYSLVSEDAAILGQVATARSGPDGRFRLENVPMNAQTLMAEHPTAGRSAPVAPGAPEQVLKLQRAGRLSGRIRLGGGPAAGMLVIVSLYNRTEVQLTATADASGAYQFEGIPPGEHMVGASAFLNGAMSTRALKKVKVGPGESVTFDMEVPVGAGSVRVLYRDAKPSEARARVSIAGPMVDSRLLSSEGTVTFSHLAPGAYNICLVRSQAVPRCSRVNVAESAEEVVF